MSGHCLRHLLPPYHSSSNLRRRGHSFHLPDYVIRYVKRIKIFLDIAICTAFQRRLIFTTVLSPFYIYINLCNYGLGYHRQSCKICVSLIDDESAVDVALLRCQWSKR